MSTGMGVSEGAGGGAGDCEPSETRLVLEITDTLANVSQSAWDACAGRRNPFVSHAFLSALEQSGSAVRETGWLAQHILLRGPRGADGSESLPGCIPLYLKNHSRGEYVFDQGWADAFERAGGRYYPKLQCSVPFSPVTGPRLLVNESAVLDGQKPDVKAIRATLADGLLQVGARHGVSNLHVTFCDAGELAAFEAAGYLLRYGHQFHWHNQDYRSFQDFLSVLSSNKRKAIRKERETVAASGVRLRILTGDDLRPHHWDAFFKFYTDTGARKWGMPYLTRDFFDRIHQTMAGRIALVIGQEYGETVCGALNMVGEDTVYGRNWGCSRFHKNLHFEACYYQAIDFAIEHKLKTVEAGAQGGHKLQRGYLPTLTYSAHFLFNEGFAQAVGGFLAQEKKAVLEELKLMKAESPFKVV